MWAHCSLTATYDNIIVASLFSGCMQHSALSRPPLSGKLNFLEGYV